jgi:predicted enzyme related to lactoylglutathione lyase
VKRSELSLAIVTSRIDVMRDFYAAVLRCEAIGDERYVEFEAGDGWRLALCASEEIERVTPGVHEPGTNRCLRIELSVDDVDDEFARLQTVVSDWIAPPTDWEWGMRSTWFRDPDGNLISLFAPVRADAR